MKNRIIKNRKWIAGFFCMLCMLLLVPQQANAASYKQLYKKFLAQKTVPLGNGDMVPNWYYMINIDKKGVPELVVTSQGNAITDYAVYTVSGGKVKYLGSYTSKGVSSVQPTFIYSSKWKGLIAEGWTNGIGGVWENMYIIKNKAVKWQYHAMTYVNRAGKQVYEVKTTYKQVSKSTYNNYLKKYFKSYKIYKMKKNTAANRKKSFG